MEIEIEIPEALVEPLLIQAAIEEVPVEEIVTRAIQKFMERGEHSGCCREERHYGQSRCGFACRDYTISARPRDDDDGVCHTGLAG